MAITSSLDTLSAGQKEELIASLAVLLVGSNGNKAAAKPTEGDDEDGADESAAPVTMSMESIQAVAGAAGCTVSASVAQLFAQVATVVPGGVAAYCMSPGGGGGGGGGGGASGGDTGGAAAAEAKPEEKEEEEEMDLGGGMDMFGGEEGGGGGGDY